MIMTKLKACLMCLTYENLKRLKIEILTIDRFGHCRSPRLLRVRTLQQQSDPSPKAVRNVTYYDFPLCRYE